jgi:hypothetical protein
MVLSLAKSVENRCKKRAKRFPLNCIYFHRKIYPQVIDMRNSKGA